MLANAFDSYLLGMPWPITILICIGIPVALWYMKVYRKKK